MATTRKSRKSPASILRFGPLMLTGLLCAFFATSGIGYVWHRNRNEQLLRDNARDRRLLEALHKENQELEAQLQALTRPDVLFARAKAMGLVQPDPSQIVRIVLTPTPAPTLRAPALHIAGRSPVGTREGGAR